MANSAPIRTRHFAAEPTVSREKNDDGTPALFEVVDPSLEAPEYWSVYRYDEYADDEHDDSSETPSTWILDISIKDYGDKAQALAEAIAESFNLVCRANKDLYEQLVRSVATGKAYTTLLDRAANEVVVKAVFPEQVQW